MVKVELTRFRIKKGKEKLAQTWMDFLNQHYEATVATMADEKMYVETVFKEESSDGYTYFYWYSIQGEGGQAVEDSENYIDKKHLEYWDECIDRNYHPIDLEVEQNLLAPTIEQGIKRNKG